LTLTVYVACINEKNGVGAGRLGLAPVKEPQSARKRDGIKQIRPDGYDHVNGIRFDEVLPEVLFGTATVSGGIGHSKTGTALVIKYRIEDLNPEVIAVVGAWGP
jgi:hypothetical protein